MSDAAPNLSDPLATLPGRWSRFARQGVTIAFLTIPGVLAVGLATLGLEQGDSPMAAIAAMIFTWCTSGLIAVGFLLSAIGYGWPVVRLLAESRRDRHFLQPAAGLAVLLFINHLIGVAGGLSGGKGRFVAAGIMALGIGLLTAQVLKIIRSRPRLPTAPWPVLLCCASVAVLLVAAASPPGVLWRSEAGGFDALSYHLPLAQEWAGGERIWPLAHNVYSYLPSYAEAGFTQMAALCGGSLVEGDGIGVLACQFVHVEQTLVAAFTVGALAAGLARGCGIGEKGQMVGGGVAFTATLATPWVVVVGSLAYNEMAGVALAAGAGLAAVSDGGAWKRGLGAGLLLGAATACKPTFFFLAGPTVGLLLLGMMPPRWWGKTVAMGMVGGLVMLGPPLVRNWVASGSPVFPLSMAMGTGQWTAQQAERFSKAHGRDGTVGEQVGRLLAYSAPVDPATGQPTTFDGEPRGVFHGQWGMMLPVGGLALVLLGLRRQTHLVGVYLALGGIAGCAFWVMATHGQSRFLIPLVINAACGLGVLGGWLAGRGEEEEEVSPLRRLSLLFVCVLPLLTSAATVRLFLTEQGGRPNRLLSAGVSWMTGEGVAARQPSLTDTQRKQIEDGASPAVFASLVMREGEKLMLVGDATPLYYLPPVIYNTVWDRSVLGRAMEAHPNEPSRWVAAMRATGATHVLFNLAEIERYRRTYGFEPSMTAERLDLLFFRLGEPIKGWMFQGVPTMLMYELPVEGPEPQGGGRV